MPAPRSPSTRPSRAALFLAPERPTSTALRVAGQNRHVVVTDVVAISAVSTTASPTVHLPPATTTMIVSFSNFTLINLGTPFTQFCRHHQRQPPHLAWYTSVHLPTSVARLSAPAFLFHLPRLVSNVPYESRVPFTVLGL